MPGLPSLSEGEVYTCFFEETQSEVIVHGSTVTCSTPLAHMVPSVPHGLGRFIKIINKYKTCFYQKYRKSLLYYYNK